MSCSNRWSSALRSVPIVETSPKIITNQEVEEAEAEDGDERVIHEARWIELHARAAVSMAPEDPPPEDDVDYVQCRGWKQRHRNQ